MAMPQQQGASFRGGSPWGSGITGAGGLAAGAAGLIAAILALWAFRGLPLGGTLLWLVPLPLFAAGLAFGVLSAAMAAAIGGLAVLFAGSFTSFGAYLGLAGVPVPLLLAAALRGGRLDLTAPLALLGILPVVMLLIAAVLLDGAEGLNTALRQGIEMGLARLGLPAPETVVQELARVKPAAIAFWLVVTWVANASIAQSLLVRQRLALLARIPWSTARLPFWYPLLPALAAGWLLGADAPADLLPLSALLMLILPLFLQGLGFVHRRLPRQRWRPVTLVLFYAALVVFLQVLGPIVAVLGLYDHFARPRLPQS